MSGDLILGIDPGLSGAMALVDYATGGLVEVVDLPTYRTKKVVLNEYAIARLLDEWTPRLIAAFVEGITPRPGQSVQAVATSAGNWGFIRGVVVGNFVPLHVVAPATWKRAMKVSGDKDEARAAASAAFPTWGSCWPSGKDGRAEAALIAAYGRRDAFPALAVA